MIIGGKDRSDYRSMTTKALIEEAVYNPNTELCIALGERLHEVHRALEQASYDLASEYD